MANGSGLGERRMPAEEAFAEIGSLLAAHRVSDDSEPLVTYAIRYFDRARRNTEAVAFRLAELAGDEHVSDKTNQGDSARVSIIHVRHVGRRPIAGIEPRDLGAEP